MRRMISALAALFVLSTSASAAASNRVAMPFGQDVFVSGINVAWKSFGGDVGKYPIDTAWFAGMLQGVADSGGNSVRWWLFTNCSNDPQFDPATKLVTGLGSSTVANVRKVLDMAYARGVSISLCLLSFDMMKSQSGVDAVANRQILQTDAGRKAFLDNAVVPLAKAVGNHPAILDWEIFNEPEGMIKTIAGDWGNMAGWVEIADVQKMVNQAAGAIHRAVPGVLVSNGCWAFIAGSNTVSGDHNYYSDSALKTVGGDADGTLDFYMVHYYEWAGKTRSPFHHPASYWGLDKPLVIAEFPAKGLSDSLADSPGGLSPANCWKYLHANGYAGAMGWTYTAHDGFGGLPEAGQGMRALKTLVPGDVTLDFPPLASDDWYLDTMGRTLSVAVPGVLGNDIEPTPGQSLVAVLLTQAEHGTVSLAANGSFVYVPAAGWTGTDRFAYLATGGAGMKDTATVLLRVLDPTKGAFFAPPRAAAWKAYAAWGKVGVLDLVEGLGVTNAQWGSAWEWIVGEGVPVQVAAGEWTVSVLVRNDPASPWAALKFHLAASGSVGNYGPTDTASRSAELAPLATDGSGFTEYRGTLDLAATASYLPSLQFVWHDTDGNGPNSAHQSIVRDLELLPSADFATSARRPTSGGLSWRTAGNGLSVSAPGEMLVLEVSDLSGRIVARIEAYDALLWRIPARSGLLVAKLRSGSKETSFLLPAVGR